MCDNYTLDVHAAFGVCKCGLPRSEHTINSNTGTGKISKDRTQLWQSGVSAPSPNLAPKQGFRSTAAEQAMMLRSSQISRNSESPIQQSEMKVPSVEDTAALFEVTQPTIPVMSTEHSLSPADAHVVEAVKVEETPAPPPVQAPPVQDHDPTIEETPPIEAPPPPIEATSSIVDETPPPVEDPALVIEEAPPFQEPPSLPVEDPLVIEETPPIEAPPPLVEATASVIDETPVEDPGLVMEEPPPPAVEETVPPSVEDASVVGDSPLPAVEEAPLRVEGPVHVIEDVPPPPPFEDTAPPPVENAPVIAEPLQPPVEEAPPPEVEKVSAVIKDVAPISKRRQSQVVHEFVAAESWQLSVGGGEAVSLVKDMGDGWAEVEKADGSRGLVPQSYLNDLNVVEAQGVVNNEDATLPIAPLSSVVIEETPTLEDTINSVESPPPVVIEETPTPEDTLTSVTVEETPTPTIPAAAAPPPPPPTRRQSQVTYDFVATEPWQLSVGGGEAVSLVKDMGDGWAEVEKADGSRGLVPQSYLNDLNVVETQRVVNNDVSENQITLPQYEEDEEEEEEDEGLKMLNEASEMAEEAMSDIKLKVVVMKGTLAKRRPTNLLAGGWKTRYFQLDNSGVLEWSDTDTGEFMGAVDIVNAEADGKALHGGGNDSSLQVFTVTPVKALGKPMELKASCSDEARDWLKAIKKLAKESDEELRDSEVDIRGSSSRRRSTIRVSESKLKTEESATIFGDLQKRRPTNMFGSMSSNSGWKTRYCVLEGTVFSWKDSKTRDIIGAVNVLNAKVEGKAALGGGTGLAYQTFLITPYEGLGKAMELKATSSDSARDWIVALQKASKGVVGKD